MIKLNNEKRQKIINNKENDIDDDSIIDNDIHKNLPLTIKPLGNLIFTKNKKNKSLYCNGLGKYFNILINKLKLNTIESFLIDEFLVYLDGDDLLNLALCNKGWYIFIFATEHSIWKNLCLDYFKNNNLSIQYKNGSWRFTYFEIIKNKINPYINKYPFSISFEHDGFYSDTLYQIFRLNKPYFKYEWIYNRNNIKRESYNNLTLNEFYEKYEKNNYPFILTGCMKNNETNEYLWNAYKEWDWNNLINLYGETIFHVNGYDWKLNNYINSYMKNNHDDKPLYLFDKKFCNKTNMSNDYFIPKYFNEDYFALLNENDRPDYRWLIIGEKYSGSTFHKDPNKTSAWNAVIRGKKKWILFPPNIIPPGVHPSKDGLNLVTPVTIMEWFENFYDEAISNNYYNNNYPLECIVNEGEIMFVPSGWWHLVLNLDDTIAITQNFVSKSNILPVLRYIDLSRHLISGLPFNDRKIFYEKFINVLKEKKPDIAQIYIDEKEKKKKTGLLINWNNMINKDKNNETKIQKNKEIKKENNNETKTENENKNENEKKKNEFSFSFSF